MRKIYKIVSLLFLISICTNVHAEVKGKYTTCTDAEYAQLDKPNLPGDEANPGYRSMASIMKYDIVHMEVKDGRLYLVGWAFKPNTPQTLGSNATVKFKLVPSGGGEDINFEVKYASGANKDDYKNLNDPKYYDLTYWNCHRSNSMCRSGHTVLLRGGFSASVDLSKLQKKKSYTVQMQHSLDDGTWVNVAVAEGHVHSDIKNINSFTAGTNKVKFKTNEFQKNVETDVGMGRVMGPSGLYCDSVFAAQKKKGVPGNWSPSESYFKDDATLILDKSDFPMACRGGVGNVCASKTSGSGAIQLYPVQVSSSKGSFDDYGWGAKISGISDSVAYIPALWINFKGKIVLEVEEGAPETNTFETKPFACEGKEVYSIYYFFEAAVHPNYGTTFTESHSKNKIADTEIIRKITRGRTIDNLDDKGMGIVKVVNTPDPNNNAEMSLEEYFNIVNSQKYDPKTWMYQEGNNFYVRHNLWKDAKSNNWVDSGTQCTLSDDYELTGEKKPKDPNTDNCRKMLQNIASGIETPPTYWSKDNWELYKNVAIQAKSAKIIKNPASDKKSNDFSIYRYYDESKSFIYDPNKRSDGENTLKELQTKFNSTDRISLRQPLVYRWDVCLNDTVTNCDPEVQSANCEPNDVEAEAYFHESDAYQTCIIPEGTEAGFTLINKDTTSEYCTVSCKDDIDIKVPNTKSAVAGQYFLLDKAIPEIKGTRTCVTDKIDYNKFDNDIKADEKDLVKLYNTYKDYNERYEDFDKYSVKVEEKHTSNMCCSSTCDGDYQYYVKSTDSSDTMQSVLNLEANKRRIGILQSSYQDFNNNYMNYTGLSFTNNSLQAFSSPATLDTIMQEIIDDDEDSGMVAVIVKKSDIEAWKSSHPGDAGKIRQIGGVKLEEYSSYKWTLAGWNSDRIRKRDSNKNVADFGPLEGQAGGIASKSCSGEVTNDDNYETTRNQFKATATTAKNDYTRKLRYEYAEKINGFASCFTWVDKAHTVGISGTGSSDLPYLTGPRTTSDDNYHYKFEPKLEFNYDDPDSRVFGNPYNYTTPSTKIDPVPEDKNPDTNVYYWNKDTTPDERYTNSTSEFAGSDKWGPNQVERKLLQCTGDVCRESTSMTINAKFYTTSHIKRTETLSYTFHLPQIYTLVPSGRVENSVQPNQARIPLDPEAVPININTKAGTYQYTLKFSNISDEIRDTRETNTVKLEERFAQEGVFNAGEKYQCNYNVTNDIYTPSDDPNELGQINFFYRPVDTYDINHPNGVPLGYNWADSRATAVIEQLRKGAESTSSLQSEENGKFSFKLTPTVMRQIRYYNAKQSSAEDASFADFNLSCYDKDSSKGYHCYSPFLSCLASGGANDEGKEHSNVASCRSIFGDTLNGSDSTFDIGTSRNKLIAKQKRYDDLNGEG